MAVVLGFLGLAMAGLVVINIVWTTLTLNGGGPLTTLLTWTVGGLMRRAAHTQFLAGLARNTGLLAILAVIAAWTLLTWVGWTLIFAAVPDAIVRNPGGAPGRLDQPGLFRWLYPDHPRHRRLPALRHLLATGDRRRLDQRFCPAHAVDHLPDPRSLGGPPATPDRPDDHQPGRRSGGSRPPKLERDRVRRSGAAPRRV